MFRLSFYRNCCTPSPLLTLLWRESGTSGTEYAAILGMVGAVAVGGALMIGHGAQQAVQSAASSAKGSGGSSSGGGGSGTGTGTGSSKTIFSDSFSSAKTSASNWIFNGSFWQVNDGSLNVGPKAAWNSLAYAQNSDFTNGTIALDADLAQGGGIGVMFHLSADPVLGSYNGYCFQYDAQYGTGSFIVRKIVNGVELTVPIAIHDAPVGYQIAYGVQRHIEVTTVGSLITAKVDGVTVLSFNDSSYSSGGAGLRLWSDPVATIDNFSITTH